MIKAFKTRFPESNSLNVIYGIMGKFYRLKNLVGNGCEPIY